MVALMEKNNLLIKYVDRLESCGINPSDPQISLLFGTYTSEPDRIEQAVQALEHRILYLPTWDKRKKFLSLAMANSWKPPLKVPKIPRIRFQRPIF
jgi:hypothetical protein